jgi:hypothetical protein
LSIEAYQITTQIFEAFLATAKFSIFLVKEGVEVLTFSEVISHPKWFYVMHDEYNSIL